MSVRAHFTTPYELLDTEVTGVDPDTGDDLVATDDVDERPPTLCYFEQTTSSETNGDRAQTAVTAMAVFAAGTPVTETSTMRIRGDVWAVTGRPDRVLRRGREHHVECQLQLVT